MPALRKDMRIGLLAGAVLLVLAVAYALFLTFSGPSAVQQAALHNETAPPEQQSAPVPGANLELPAPAASEEQVPIRPPILAQSEEAPADDWSVLGLGTGPIVTETPAPGALNPLAQQPAPDPAGGLPDVQPQMYLPLQERLDPAVAEVDGLPNVRAHVIAAGETLSAIAKKYYGDENLYTLIEKANPNVDARRLKVGQKLLVPDRDTGRQQSAAQQPAAQQATPPAPAGDAQAASADPTVYVVAAGDTLGSIAKVRYGREQFWQEIYNLNRDVIGDDPARLKVGMKLKMPQ